MANAPTADPAARLVVITGGPGAGKTALLELARRRYRDELIILPESASILFGGGFPRRPAAPWLKAAQRSIFYVQRQLERAALEANHTPIVLCDRGTLDGLAYWPDTDAGLLFEVGTSREVELARYAAVIHLQVPPPETFNHSNPLRIETPDQAEAIDHRIEQAWAGHPRRYILPSTADFLAKVESALTILNQLVPPAYQRAQSA